MVVIVIVVVIVRAALLGVLVVVVRSALLGVLVVVVAVRRLVGVVVRWRVDYRPGRPPRGGRTSGRPTAVLVGGTR
jgi:hypothetical protein